MIVYKDFIWSTEQKKFSSWQSSADQWGYCLGSGCFTCYQCLNFIPHFASRMYKLLEPNHTKRLPLLLNTAGLRDLLGKEAKSLNDAFNLWQSQTPRISNWTSRNRTRGMQTPFCLSEPALTLPSLSLNSQGLEFPKKSKKKHDVCHIHLLQMLCFFITIVRKGCISPYFRHRSAERQREHSLACQVVINMGWCLLCTQHSHITSCDFETQITHH